MPYRLNPRADVIFTKAFGLGTDIRTVIGVEAGCWRAMSDETLKILRRPSRQGRGWRLGGGGIRSANREVRELARLVRRRHKFSAFGDLASLRLCVAGLSVLPAPNGSRPFLSINEARPIRRRLGRQQFGWRRFGGSRVISFRPPLHRVDVTQVVSIQHSETIGARGSWTAYEPGSDTSKMETTFKTRGMRVCERDSSIQSHMWPLMNFEDVSRRSKLERDGRATRADSRAHRPTQPRGHRRRLPLRISGQHRSATRQRCRRSRCDAQVTHPSRAREPGEAASGHLRMARAS